MGPWARRCRSPRVPWAAVNLAISCSFELYESSGELEVLLVLEVLDDVRAVVLAPRVHVQRVFYLTRRRGRAVAGAGFVVYHRHSVRREPPIAAPAAAAIKRRARNSLGGRRRGEDPDRFVAIGHVPSFSFVTAIPLMFCLFRRGVGKNEIGLI